MSNYASLSSARWQAQVIEAVYWFLPLLAGACFFLFSKINPVSRDNPVGTRRSNAHMVVLWLMAIVLITYTLHSTVLLYLSFPENALVFKDTVVFDLSSIFLWFVFILDFSERRRSAWSSLATCSVIYLFSESFLLAFAPGPKNIGKSLTKTLIAVRVLRLGILLLLFGIAIVYRLMPIERRCNDEEAPLLRDRDSGAHDNSRLGRNVGENHYGGTTRGQLPGPENDGPQHEPIGLLGSITFFAPLFWPHNRPLLRLQFAGVGLCLVVERYVTALIPVFMGWLVDCIIQNRGGIPWKQITTFTILIFLNSAGGVSALRDFLWLPIENHIYFEISAAAFNKIMTLSRDFHERGNPESLSESVNRGLSARDFLRCILFQMIPMTIDFPVAVAMLYVVFDAYVAWVVAVPLAISIYLSSKISLKLQEQKAQLIADMEREHYVLRESISNWLTASYFNRISLEKDRYHTAVTNHLYSSHQFYLLSRFDSLARSFLFTSSLMGACSLAIYQILSSNKPIASIVVLLGYWMWMSGHLQTFANGACQVAEGIRNAHELALLLNTEPSVSERTNPKALTVNRGMIEFRDIGFGYDAYNRVLNGISFQALGGQTVAIVGETGAGKSTILKLLLRLYDPIKGTIAIDGQDIRNVSLESLRADIGVVPQDASLINDTIMNNIRYASYSAQEEQIYEVCKAVGLHDKFASLPDGYYSFVGERGVKLSGGEIQRIAIARALVKNPKIVILDEAMSNLDGHTDSLVRRSLRRLCAGRTTLVVAHRLSTIVRADKIIALRHGKIVEQGDHDSLLAANGYYARLWSRQVRVKLPQPKCTDASSLPQQVSVDKGKGRAENVSNLAVAKYPYSPADDVPMLLNVGKLRSKDIRPTTSLDPKESQPGPSVDRRTFERKSEGKDSAVSKRNELKPDAPEFVPLSQRHGEHRAAADSKVVQGQLAGGRENEPVHDQLGKEDPPTTLGSCTNKKSATENDHSVSETEPSKKHSTLGNSSSKRIDSVLQQTSNGVVMAYPKKARKKTKGSRKRSALRKRRIESEPVGIGMKI